MSKKAKNSRNLTHERALVSASASRPPAACLELGAGRLLRSNLLFGRRHVEARRKIALIGSKPQLVLMLLGLTTGSTKDLTRLIIRAFLGDADGGMGKPRAEA
jgi:hypothetical protein